MKVLLKMRGGIAGDTEFEPIDLEEVDAEARASLRALFGAKELGKFLASPTQARQTESSDSLTWEIEMLGDPEQDDRTLHISDREKSAEPAAQDLVELLWRLARPASQS